MWDWDLISGEIEWAGTTEPYFRLSPERMRDLRQNHYRLWSDRVHPDDLSATEAAAQAAIAGGAESWQHEYRFRRADGSYADILERAFIARDERGQALRAVGQPAPGVPRDTLAEELRAWVRVRLAAHEVPREVLIVDELPTTATGKVVRRALR